MPINFTIKKECCAARVGVIDTAHGKINTPVFMPVGTLGTVKAMLPESLVAIGSEIILGNTYHLMLRPGEDVVERLGGLHKFMQWSKPILTDSGGFQVMSLASLRKITEDGVEFRSQLDGKKYFLDPKKSIKIQHKLGSNISMIFDECISYPTTFDYAKKSMELSLNWAKKSKSAFIDREGFGIFGIIQGSVFPNLRHASIEGLSGIGFDGYAIGGLAVGEGYDKMIEVLDYTVPNMIKEKPRYLMGVGKPVDIISSVKRGIDMFDCVIPTRSGRNGQAFIRGGVINIRNSKYVLDDTPLDKRCFCYVCKRFSKGYLNHLVKNKEILGCMLITWHNITYYINLMQRLRDLINSNTLHNIEDKEII